MPDMGTVLVFGVNKGTVLLFDFNQTGEPSLRFYYLSAKMKALTGDVL